jgi:hypothetical protein
MTATEQRHRLWSRCWPHRAVSPPRASFGVPAPYPRRPLESLLVPSSSPHDTTPSDQRRRFRILCCPIRCPHRVFLPPEAGHHNEEPTPGFEPGTPSLREKRVGVLKGPLEGNGARLERTAAPSSRPTERTPGHAVRDRPAQPNSSHAWATCAAIAFSARLPQVRGS